MVWPDPNSNPRSTSHTRERSPLHHRPAYGHDVSSVVTQNSNIYKKTKTIWLRKNNVNINYSWHALTLWYKCNNVYWIQVLWDQRLAYMLEKTEGAIKNGRSRETDNIGCTKHKTKTNKAKSATQYVLEIVADITLWNSCNSCINLLYCGMNTGSWTLRRMSDCCLTPTQQFFSYIMAKIS